MHPALGIFSLMPTYQMTRVDGKIIRTLIPDVAAPAVVAPVITKQPTLPGPFLPPAPDCKVKGGDHVWITINSYSKVRYWPDSAYEPYCTFCGESKPKR